MVPKTPWLKLASGPNMSISTLVMLLGVWGALPAAHAKDDLTSPQYAACVDKSGGNTWDMIQCDEVELKQQDDSLNKSYRALSAKLTSQRRKQLVDAQRAWISFRDANCNFYSDPDGGQAARLAGSSCLLTATAERAREIQSLLESE